MLSVIVVLTIQHFEFLTLLVGWQKWHPD